LKCPVTVAAIVAEHFDGMVVPGVRGDRHQTYANVVLFRPLDRWRDWAARDTVPRMLTAE
jgi:hypothetical protein